MPGTPVTVPADDVAATNALLYSEIWLYDKPGYAAEDIVLKLYNSMQTDVGYYPYEAPVVLDLPGDGMLFEEGIWVFMNERDMGVTLFFEGGEGV